MGINNSWRAWKMKTIHWSWECGFFAGRVLWSQTPPEGEQHWNLDGQVLTLPFLDSDSFYAEEPGRLQSMGATKSQLRLSDSVHTHILGHWLSCNCLHTQNNRSVVLWVKHQTAASLWSWTSYHYNSVSNIPSTSLIALGPASVRQEPTFCMTGSLDKKSNSLHNWKDSTELHFSCGSCDLLYLLPFKMD